MVSLAEFTPTFAISVFFFIFIVGTIGNLLNLMTLLSKDFRTKSCTFYMICGSLLDLVHNMFTITVRLSTEYFGNSATSITRDVCKLRGYLPICLSTMVATCVSLATFDRFMSTSLSVHWRNLSSIWFAKRLFFISMLIVIISGMFQLIIFDIYNGICTVSSNFEKILVAVYADTFTLLISHGGMLY
ncbi:hypothetical protein I4U23_027507 [Adineta vaga]|nr:hypothetical protein I4U23_027507 [Adineta vaga]